MPVNRPVELVDPPETRDTTGRLNALRQALVAGEQSGDFQPFDFDRFIEEKRQADRQ